MVNTNRQDYKKDLEEVIFMFSDGSDIELEHKEENDGKIFKNYFNLNGKDFYFENTATCKDELSLKRIEKRFSKLGLYKILSEYYNLKLEWGALTGIRPTKMAYQAGENFEKEFDEIFSVSPKKIALIKDILDTQKGIIDLKGEYQDVFVSIPFCPTKCLYCSFISQQITKKQMVKDYVKTLIKEIENGLNLIKNSRSLYIGGGTPVSLDEEDLESLLTTLKPIISKVSEFTVEAGRPDVITSEKLAILKKHGVTRVCVNPQTFNDQTLKIIGRKHTAQDILDKYELVKSFGFSINMDFIAGLPGETFIDFENSINTAIKLNPDNITVHTLCLKKGSVLKEKVKRLSDKEISKMIDFSHEVLKQNGYNPYYLYRQKYMAGNLENTGYSKKGKECIYNIDVMEETSSNIAFGANAVSKIVFLDENRIERYGTPKDVITYLNKIDIIIKDKENLFNSL